jgi:hypothetical protein
MAALTDRQKAREKLSLIFQTILDKMIPPDTTVPLEGVKFIDWEDQGDELARTMVPLFLEERAALDAAAQADCGGRCPACKSDRVYLIKEIGNIEVTTPFGPVVLKKQRCRCRECDRSFSPSAAGLGAAHRSRSVTKGGGASGS